MATLTVDTDGVSGTYANLNAAFAGLADPFTESMIISCDASTSVKDTTSAVDKIIDTTASYTLTITGTDDYIYAPSDAAQLSFDHSFSNVYNIIIDGINFEKPSMNAAYQPCFKTGPVRDGDIVVKNSSFIGVSGTTDRERLLDITLFASGNCTIAVVNNYFRTKGSSTHSASACLAHSTDRPAYMYNNTIIGNKPIFTAASNALYINNIINTTVNGDTPSTSSNYNMFSGAFDFGGAQDEQSKTFTFVNLGADDVHLQSGDTGARGKGTDLSGDASFPFDYDQDGVTRSAWDAGAFEFVAAGGAANPWYYYLIQGDD